MGASKQPVKLSGLVPTDEQARSLESSARRKRIRARAGTGKTSNLQLVAERNPRKKILYLVFNKSQRVSAQAKFPANTIAHTGHSLAYRYEGYNWKDSLTTNFSPHVFLPAFEDYDDPHALAQYAYSFVNFHLNAPFAKFDESVPHFLPYLNEERGKEFTAHLPAILRACHELTNAWHNKKEPCPHDFYLKLFHMDGRFQEVVNSYDIVLFDEMQDSTRLIMDVAARCTSEMFMVGDDYQEIYQWRYTQNAMRLVDCDAEFDLTQAFRFGAPIADFTQRFVRETLDEEFIIRGNPKMDSMVYQYRNHRRLPPIDAVLSRTNMTLFGEVLRCREHDIPYRFERDLTGTLCHLIDVYWLGCRKHEKIRDPFIKSFSSMVAAEEHAEKMGDLNLMSSLNIVTSYYSLMPGVLFDILRESKNTPEDDSVCITTIHASKGCEYQNVMLAEDIATMLNRQDVDDETLRLAYVAMTRAKEQVFIPEQMGDSLSVDWQTYVHQLPYAA